MINCSFRIENDEDEKNDNNDIADYPPDERANESLYDSQNAIDEGGNEEEQEGILDSTKSDLRGMRIADNINPTLRHSYFKIKIKDRSKYMHKRSACWLQLNQIKKLSSVLLSRVMQETSNSN
ncbi:unnamed protein product [Adineta ricciae]|uniref:Uncharacterized protein n=1 Tax=Adineta ricciae TaxID=249248 RepID=A0A813SAU5_ADIRI|nr:unnamed protein product [Adineta ricciae]CAF0791966.1 unnamed protein product [Adineta ricciae]